MYIGIQTGDPYCKIDWLLENVSGETGEFLVLSQFTLFGAFKGSKPSFHRAEGSQAALEYFGRVCVEMRRAFPGKVQTGVFGRDLDVYLELPGECSNVVRLLESP